MHFLLLALAAVLLGLLLRFRARRPGTRYAARFCWPIAAILLTVFLVSLAAPAFTRMSQGLGLLLSAGVGIWGYLHRPRA